MYIAEFEFVPEDGMIATYPFYPGRDDATAGESIEKAIESAADWLREVALTNLMQGVERPALSLNNNPRHGGKIICVAVDVSLSDVPAMTATEAARMLDVSQGRITQLCSAGLLDSWKVGSTRMISEESVKLRLAADRRAGRPRKELALA